MQMDPKFQLDIVTEKCTLELQDLFAEMGIGRGLQEYERGKAILQGDMGFQDDKEYQQAIKELARWCEV